jgi:hypothetical protein
LSSSFGALFLGRVVAISLFIFSLLFPVVLLLLLLFVSQMSTYLIHIATVATCIKPVVECEENKPLRERSATWPISATPSAKFAPLPVLVRGYKKPVEY